MPIDTPGVAVRMPVYAACSTSFPPNQTDTKEGSASSARCTWVLPPRMTVVRAFEAVVPGEVGSQDCASGTATLFRNSVTDAAVRAEHSGVPPPTRVCVMKLLIGGGQPGIVRAA